MSAPAMARYGKRARGKTAKRTPSGMNKGELAYDTHLDVLQRAGQIAWHRAECMKLRLADNTFYTPDQMVMTNEGWLEAHEVKARTTKKREDGSKYDTFWAHEDARLKLKVVAEQYPMYRFVVVYPSREGGWHVEEI